MRRLKSALFRNKYVLYEDDCLQVGFKSTAIYEKVDKFTSMIDFELFFGNKTSKTIDKFEVSFRGDKRKPSFMQKALYIPIRKWLTALSSHNHK